MRIGTIAKKAGVGVETVRFYERRGLITQPARPSSGGFRSYPSGIVERIRFVRRAQDLGFTLKEIGELLALRASPSADCAEVRARAETKLAAVNEKITRLVAIRSALQDLIGACPGQGPASRCCSILEALETQGTPMARDGRCKETKA